ncbi:MAG: phospholipase [Deltaproteobacteria bacterium]|nr:phospholipase [Deltaproteobacteria bacterium]
MPSVRIFIVFIVIALIFSGDVVAKESDGIESLSRVSLLANHDYYKDLLKHIRGAKSEIFVAAYIFKTSPQTGLPYKVMQELILASQRGVRVEVLLERSDQQDSLNSYNRETALKLGKAGIKVCFDSPNKTTHSKLVIIDGRYVFIGSHNITPSGLKHNNELSVLIDSPILANQTKKYWQKSCRQWHDARTER